MSEELERLIRQHLRPLEERLMRFARSSRPIDAETVELVSTSIRDATEEWDLRHTRRWGWKAPLRLPGFPDL